jgi:hypothetical protein
LVNWLVVLGGCAPPEVPERLLVVQRGADGTYALGERERGTLDDPRRLRGELGQGQRGGELTATYEAGGQLDIRWTIDQGAAVPTDEQGLVMWSFWYHLSDARDAVAPYVDPSPIFPVNIAWSPQSLLDVQAVENAAFVLGQNTFMLFPDALDNVPIAANAGVVRHEFGHAFFELLVAGESGGDIPWLEESVRDILAVNALNEGFADMVATLTLDDPRFIDASLSMPSRDVSDKSWFASGDMYPDEDAGLIDAVGGYDKYALGTVYASFVWDVREATDPDTALGLAIEALVAYGEAEAWENPDQFVLSFLDIAKGEARDAACASAGTRFPELDISGVCP